MVILRPRYGIRMTFINSTEPSYASNEELLKMRE